MPRLQTVLLDPAGRDQATVLEVLEGVCRVYCPCEETEGMTLAFLQSGDRLRTDRMCSDGACVEALTALKFRRDSVSADEFGIDAVNEWTLQLLRVRHLVKRNSGFTLFWRSWLTGLDFVAAMLISFLFV